MPEVAAILRAGQGGQHPAMFDLGWRPLRRQRQ